MKVFLLQDIAKVGRRHEIKDVADGFGRNVLLPQGKVLLVDAKNQARIQEIINSDKSGKEAVDKRAKEVKQKLTGAVVQIEAKANDQGHVFAAIRPVDIVKSLAEQGIEVLDKELFVSAPIRKVGQHEITWRLGQVEQKFILKITAT